MLVTVLTPTYNRVNTLKKLYDSLINQTNKNFEWVVVDDGSSDNTDALINSFTDQGIIKIVYIKKANGGKHTAVNKGLEYSHGDMIFIVDSDDYLTDNAIERISFYCDKYKNNDKLCGFSFLRGFSNGEVNGLKYPKNEEISNYNNYRIKKNIYGDKAEVYYKNVIEKYPFPEIENEKFISEDVVWIKMANSYETVYINEIIYIGEYLDNGLTSNDKRVKFKSPIGSAIRGLTFMNSKLPLKYKIKGAIIYNCYKLEIKNKSSLLEKGSLFNKMLIFFTIIPGLVFNKKWKKEV